jgi:hypothetical protein
VTLNGERDIRQHATHAKLITQDQSDHGVSDSRRGPDAIIVPASRPAHNLGDAITLARATRSQLVILSSRGTDVAEVDELLAARSFSAATVIEIPHGYSHELFKFETTDWIKEKLPDECAVRDSDLSIKRNVGLVLARMLGWQRIFFLDDDIRDLSADALLATVSMIDDDKSSKQRYRSAGMWAEKFPDNSVVCHARREIGEFQDVFVSGSALAVDCTVPFAFFPDVYNEDWLFFYQDAAVRRLGSSGYTVTQLTYDPFADPQRAAAQEFGDIVAEGLYALLDEGLSVEHATVARWEQFIADRKRILSDIIDRSEKVSPNVREKLTYTVEKARKCLEEIRPEMCEEYIAAWRNDLKLWGDRRDRLPRLESIGKALSELGFP